MNLSLTDQIPMTMTVVTVGGRQRILRSSRPMMTSGLVSQMRKSFRKTMSFENKMTDQLDPNLFANEIIGMKRVVGDEMNPAGMDEMDDIVAKS